MGVVRGRGGPRLRSLGRPAARQTKDGPWERKARRRARRFPRGAVRVPCQCDSQPPPVLPNATTCAGPGRPPATVARPAATRQRPPRPSRNGVQRGGFLAVATYNRCSRRSPQISAGGDTKRRLFPFAFPETLRVTTPPAPRSSQVVQNQRILVQTRPPRPGGVVNKTQPKAPQPRDTFAIRVELRSFPQFFLALFWQISA